MDLECVDGVGEEHGITGPDGERGAECLAALVCEFCTRGSVRGKGRKQEGYVSGKGREEVKGRRDDAPLPMMVRLPARSCWLAFITMTLKAVCSGFKVPSSGFKVQSLGSV